MIKTVQLETEQHDNDMIEEYSHQLRHNWTSMCTTWHSYQHYTDRHHKVPTTVPHCSPAVVRSSVSAAGPRLFHRATSCRCGKVSSRSLDCLVSHHAMCKFLLCFCKAGTRAAVYTVHLQQQGNGATLPRITVTRYFNISSCSYATAVDDVVNFSMFNFTNIEILIWNIAPRTY